MNKKVATKKNRRNSQLPAVRKAQSLQTLSPMQLYLQELARYPLLKPEEELELAIKHYESQDKLAAHRLITSNLRLVVKIANDFSRAQSGLLDLIQEGNYGLAVAVKKYNPYKGVRLSSYAAWWIRAYILKYLLDNHSQVKLATTAAQRKIFYNLEKETRKLLQQGADVDISIIADSLNVSQKDVLEMQKRLQSQDVSLDATYDSEDGSGLSISDKLFDEQSSSLEDILADNQVKAIFAQHLEEFKAQLSGRDLEFFTARLMSDSPVTLQELGNRYSVSRERARQIEVRILKKLKDFVKEKGRLEF
jgi:RNA polymerase sigma-32 factor